MDRFIKQDARRSSEEETGAFCASLGQAHATAVVGIPCMSPCGLLKWVLRAGSTRSLLVPGRIFAKIQQSEADWKQIFSVSKFFERYLHALMCRLSLHDVFPD